MMRYPFAHYHKIFLSLPVKLLLVIISAFLLGDFLPSNIKASLLTISVTMKEILLFVLPAIVFFLVFSSFAQLSGSFLVFTGLLISSVCLSNFSAVMTAYPVGIISQNFIATSITKGTHNLELLPYFTLSLPHICSNTVALAAGVILGVYASAKDNSQMKSIASWGAKLVNTFLARIFTPLLPVFILGFIIKAQHDGLLLVLFRNFIPLLSVIICLFFIYIGSLYFLAFNYRISRTFIAIKNILPATLVGFSAMSSAAAMPILITGAVENAKDQNIPRRVIPFVTNTHMLGDALAIPLMAMSLYIVEYGELPHITMYSMFALSYMLAKFASAGIPGGTILIMTPVLESKLGFTSEMSTIILTTYLLFDPFCTFGNILGNGSFAKIFETLKSRLITEKNVDTNTLKGLL